MKLFGSKFLTMIAAFAVSMLFAINCTFASSIAETTDVVMQVDINPLLALLLTLAAAVAAPLLFAGYKWVLRKVGVAGIVSDDAVKALLDKYLDDAVKYGINKLEKADWTKIETKNAIVGHASNYVINQAPALLKKAKLDPEQLEARIEAAMLKYDQAPGTWESEKQV